VTPSGVPSLSTTGLTGTWYRAIQIKFWPTALATSHTASFPSRFNNGSTTSPTFEIMYLAENHQVALFEVQALLGSPLPPGLIVPSPHFTWVVLNVGVNLQVVVDLTKQSVQGKIPTTAQVLTGDWRGYHHRGAIHGSIPHPTAPAPTQVLGAALYGVANLEGFISLSARVPTHKILAVFPQKMLRGCSILFHHPDPAKDPQEIAGSQSRR
jgi:RES domain-containing protein